MPACGAEHPVIDNVVCSLDEHEEGLHEAADTSADLDDARYYWDGDRRELGDPEPLADPPPPDDADDPVLEDVPTIEERLAALEAKANA